MLGDLAKANIVQFAPNNLWLALSLCSWMISLSPKSHNKKDFVSNPTWLSRQINIYYIYNLHRAIDLMSRLFANGPGDWGSIPGQVIPKKK